MKLLLTFIVIVSAASSVLAENEKIVPTENDAVALVEKTVEDIKGNTIETFKKIIQGQKEYWNRSNPDFLVFVLDETGKVVAHPRKMMMLKNCLFIKDINGKKYRFDAIETAFKDGDGWLSYTLKKPKVKGGETYTKKSYFSLVEGTDKRKYIVFCDIKVK